MLHQDPLMVDIDVNHWRNLQALVLESAKEKPRIIVIHEAGEIQKFVHSQRLEIVRSVARVDDPHAVAQKIFAANADKVDFVAVFERRAFDRYMAQWQDAWRQDEDLDAFVQRTYATMDEFGDAIVTYPGPARSTLGLQWRLGTSYADVKAAVQHFVPANTGVVFGIFEADEPWATLVLRFDGDRRADVVTTIDMSELDASGGRDATAQAMVDWVDRKYGRCSLALFTDQAGARLFLSASDKAAAVRKIAANYWLRAERVPPALTALIPVAA